jgi:hypothetical protein
MDKNTIIGSAIGSKKFNHKNVRKPSKTKEKTFNKKKNKRYLWSNALHVRFLIGMVDWAEKFAVTKKLHGYMGPVAQKLVTVDELGAHKLAARRACEEAREKLIVATNAQIIIDYDNQDKMYIPTTTTPSLCFTDFPVRSSIPPPVPAAVTAPVKQEGHVATSSRKRELKNNHSSTSRLSKKRKKHINSISASNTNEDNNTNHSLDGESARRGSQDHEAAKQLFEFLVPGSPPPLGYSQQNSNDGSPAQSRRHSQK